MGRLYFFLYIFLFPFCSYGQDTIVVVSNDKMNILYRGIPNPVSISVSGIPADKLIVTMSDSCAISGKNGRYIVQVPFKIKGDVAIFVSVETKTGIKKVRDVNFRVKNVPMPSVCFAGICAENCTVAGEIIFLKELKEQKGITVTHLNFDFNVKYPILSFEVTLQHGARSTTEKSEGGSRLSEKQQTLINTAEVGDIVYFDNVKVISLGGAIINLSPLKLKVIETR